MDAKLIKLTDSKESNFALKVLDIYIPVWAQSVRKIEMSAYSIIASTSILTPFIKLSHKNCEAISLDYDLDELSESLFGGDVAGYVAFKSGFQKRSEILVNKQFTKEDMINFSWWLQKNIGQYNDEETAHFKGDYLKKRESKNLNSWDVVVVCEMDRHTNTAIPKLDSDGCLILKKL